MLAEIDAEIAHNKVTAKGLLAANRELEKKRTIVEKLL